jgi:hypothetical protein
MTSATKAQLDLWPVAFNPIIRVFDGNVLWEIRRRRIAGVIQKIFVIESLLLCRRELAHEGNNKVLEDPERKRI